MPENIIAELSWRELIAQTTDEKLEQKLQAEAFTLYCGFDPTADSLAAHHLIRAAESCALSKGRAFADCGRRRRHGIHWRSVGQIRRAPVAHRRISSRIMLQA